MDIAIVAPCPIPYMIGGAENLWRGLQDHLNEHTPHQAEIIKLPSRELVVLGADRLLPAVRRARPDGLRPRRLVQVPGVDGQPPAPRRLHAAPAARPLRHLRRDASASGLSGSAAGGASSCGRSWRRTRERAMRCPSSSSAWRRCAARPACARTCSRSPARSSASSCTSSTASGSRPTRSAATARSRPRWPSAPATSRPAPTCSSRTRRPGSTGSRRASAGATCSRLAGSTAPKRIDLLIARDGARARRRSSCGSPAPGPTEARLRELAAGDPRIAFCGRVSDATSSPTLYAGARAVAFVPYEEDFGLVTLEAMRARQAGHHLHRLRRHRRARHATARPASSSSRRRRRWRRRSTSCGRTGARRGGWARAGLERARSA